MDLTKNLLITIGWATKNKDKAQEREEEEQEEKKRAS